MARVIYSAWIYDRAPFPSCHASTLAEVAQGRFAVAWFGGREEGAPDVGIWLALGSPEGWSAPAQVAPPGAHPCWNPVLYQEAGGDLLLFYKAGPSPREWWGLLRRSADGGLTWTAEERLPWIGPVKNKPVRLAGGDLLCPSSDETGGRWTVHLERRSPGGEWRRTPALQDPSGYAGIQPALLFERDGTLRILCRSKQGGIIESRSVDDGFTWSPLVSGGLLPNPNSGIDAVTLRDGRHMLVYNPQSRGRSRLAVALAEHQDDWQSILQLENQPGSEFSYPAVIQAADGRVHITYTWKRKRIKYVVIEL